MIFLYALLPRHYSLMMHDETTMHRHPLDWPEQTMSTHFSRDRDHAMSGTLAQDTNSRIVLSPRPESVNAWPFDKTAV
jgi:hypothetical protein